MKKNMFRLNATSVVVVLGLSACAIGPNYVKPNIEMPAAYKENGLWKPAAPADASPRGAWWEVYGDSQLNQLMQTLNAQSPSIAQAEAQYRQAKELLNQAEATLYPGVTANAGETRGVTTAGNGVSKQYSLGVNASWEIDLWGSVRRAIEAGKAKEAGSAAQLAAIKLSTQAQLVTAYLQLVIADKQSGILLENEKALEETLKLTRNQFAAGIVSDANVQLAESQWKSAQAATADKRLTRAQLEHAVAVTLGQTPASFTLNLGQSLPHLPQLPAGLPSTLLERRPDIAVAERNVAQLNAQIGLTESAYFPVLTLAASGAYRGSSLSDWISAPNRIWSLGPQLAATLFDGGVRKAQTAQAIAAYDAGVAAYKQTLLSAFQGVEDSLAAQSSLQNQVELQTDAVNAARKSEQISLNQYAAGTISYINVLTAQSARITAESNLWTIKNRQYVNSVALIAAIGGNW